MKSAATLFEEAWDFFITHWKTLVLLVLPISVSDVAFQLYATSQFGYETDITLTSVLVSMCIGILSFVLTYFSYTAIVLTCLDAGVRPVSAYMGDAFSRLGSVLFAGVLSSIVIVLGFLLIIIPGIIASLALSLTTYIVIIENVHGLNALKRSYQYVSRAWFEMVTKLAFITVVSIIFIGIQALVMFIIPIDILATIAGEGIWVIMTAVAMVYGYNMFREFQLLNASQSVNGDASETTPDGSVS